MLTNKILASIVHSEVLDPTHLSETLVHDLSLAETSTIAPVTATPVTTSITATPVAPQITLPTNAMGSQPHLTEVSRPGSRTPLRPLVIKWELVNHPDKAFIEQLIAYLRSSWLFYWLQFPAIAKHLSSALRHTIIINESLKKDRNRTHSWTI